MSDRMKPFAGGKDPSSMHDHDGNGRREKRHTDDFELSAIPKLLKGLDTRKFGSVSKEIEALCARRSKILKYDTLMNPKSSGTHVDEPNKLCEQSSPKNWQVNQLSQDKGIDLKAGHLLFDISAAASSVVDLSSYNEDSGDRRRTRLYEKVEPARRIPVKILMVQDALESSTQKEEEVNQGRSNIGMDNNTYFTPEMAEVIQENNLKSSARKKGSDQIETEDEKMDNIESKSPISNVERKDLKIDNQIHAYEYGNAENYHVVEDDLAYLWNEMAVALEFSKDGVGDTSTDEQAEDEGCDHSFVLKDDIGYVCRVCGVIQTGIESIIEYSYNKGKRTSRTYISESRNASHKGSTKILQSGFKTSIEELMPTKISAHPRHMKQMKPHQVEGFNFLCCNLTTDNPGGCILAHAPGSGKTFMIISFMQSFLAMSPHARPLVVLPKGILATWKKEFQTWQVEDIPLYDFYTVKADNRAQQLSILRKWVEHKSILFLGYKQFSTIICDYGTEAVECQEILLNVPTILVLDEGHTPRNEETDVLQSLARVKTPLKVVLSGTLYQNHVKEVFNILKLVRPKFMKSQTSRDIQRRIMSRVHISRMRNPSKGGSDSVFFELVEKTLQQKDDFKRKAAVIQDLREMTSKVLHYYKGHFLDELPGLVDYTLLLNLSSRQKSEVEKLKQLDHFKRTSVGSLMYVHPQLKSFSEKFSSNGEKGSSIDDEKMDNMVKRLIVRDGAKAKFFVNILNLCQSAGEKLLVFSQYILPLKLFERLSIKFNGWSRNKELFMITGDSNHEQREWSMERFNNSPDAKVFFGSIKACGEGISLVGASRIIILDVHLNPSVTRQAIGRAFRPGQKRKVYTYRLVAADSPEEEDHNTCFRKELIAKMWFEWNENCGNQQFEMKAIDVNECGDPFLESPSLREDIKTLYKR